MPRALLVAKSETKRKLAGEDVGGEGRPVSSALAHGGKGRREIAFGEAAAIFMRHQRMVKIGRLREAEQFLEQPLDRRRCAKIGTPNDHRHAALRIVDDAGQVIGSRRVLAGENGVADVAFGGGEGSAVGLGP